MSSTRSKAGDGVSITLEDGRTLSLRPIRGNDLVAMSGNDVGDLLARIKAGVIEQSWEGDILEEEWDVLRHVIRNWRLGTENQAVPQPSGEVSP